MTPLAVSDKLKIKLSAQMIFGFLRAFLAIDWTYSYLDLIKQLYGQVFFDDIDKRLMK